MQFKLLMPANEKLVPAVRLVAERAAQCAGFTASEAQRIGSSIGGAVEIVLARLRAQASSRGETGTADEPLDIRLVRDGAYLDVWLRYRADECERPVVDPTLSGEALRLGMDSAEFGREGEIAFCRLRRLLPREKVDHQCEVPPEQQ